MSMRKPPWLVNVYQSVGGAAVAVGAAVPALLGDTVAFVSPVAGALDDANISAIRLSAGSTLEITQSVSRIVSASPPSTARVMLPSRRRAARVGRCSVDRGGNRSMGSFPSYQPRVGSGSWYVAWPY